MKTRSSDNTEPNAKDFHIAIGEDTPLRAQAPALLTMTQDEFEERVAEAVRDAAQNTTSSSTTFRANVATPIRSRRGKARKQS